MSRRRKALLLGGAAVVGLVAWWAFTGSEEDPPPARSTSPALVALGDSYISGEGAGSFEPGTNIVGSNECRRAQTSHPYRVAEALGAEMVSVACSGAKTVDLLTPEEPAERDGQYPNSKAGVVGAEKQLEALAGYDPDVVLLSIGGNDIGFAQIVRACLLPTSCLGRVEEYYDRIAKVEPKLRQTYQAVRAQFSDATVFVVNYPMPVDENACPRAFLGADEFEFVDEFVHQFDQTINLAATAEGLEVVDIEDAFEGHQICGPAPESEQAMNSLIVNKPRYRAGDLAGWFKRFSSNFHNSYHPTPYGHYLIANAVLKQIAAAASERTETEAADSNPIPLPPEGGPPTEAPPWVPIEVLPPEGPYGAEPLEGTGCSGGQVVASAPPVPVHANDASVSFIVVTVPGSDVCFRSYKGAWEQVTADPDGKAKVTLRFGTRHGVSSTHEVFYQVQPGAWVKVNVARA